MELKSQIHSTTAYASTKKNGYTLCQDTIRQEMSKVDIAFQTLDDDDEAIPLTYQEMMKPFL
jgi:hypothetical protein